MKQCISKVIIFFTYLWRTLKEYVCKRKNKKTVYLKDVDNDGIKEVVIDPNGEPEDQE